MLPSITASSSGHWNQDGSRRWQRATPLAVEAHPDQHVAAEAFDQRQAFARLAGAALIVAPDRAVRQPPQDLLDQRQALLDLANADPDARIDIAFVEHRHVEIELDHRADRRARGARRRRGPQARPT